MSLSTSQRVETLAVIEPSTAWQAVCREQDLVSNSGVVVWLDGDQVALFYLPMPRAAPCTPSITTTRSRGPTSSAAA